MEKTKMAYYLRVFRQASFGKFFKVVNTASERSGKSKAFCFFDILKCMRKFQAGYNDYVIFEWWDLTDEQRDTYMTRFRSKKFIMFMNDHDYAHYFDNKNEFNEKFKDFIGRECVDLETASHEDIVNFFNTREKIFAKMKDLGRSYGKNLIFVGLDARERNSLGAEALWNDIESGRLKDPGTGETITPAKIHSVVVLDILGSTLSPIHKGKKDYLIMLSGGNYAYDLQRANENPGLGLDLGFDYYGSEGFTDMFRARVGDQKIFSQEGAFCVVFTSGITMKTNKVEDDYLSLNYDIFKRRIFLIFHWLTKVL